MARTSAELTAEEIQRVEELEAVPNSKYVYKNSS
jgi:hypothetical protein